MSDDEILKALASEAARQDRQVDPRLDRLVRRSLPAHDVAKLREEGSEDSDLALALELFEPLPDDAMDRLAEHVEQASHHTEAAEPPKQHNVLPFRGRSLARLAAVAAPIALAAGVALWLQARSPDPLPAYELGSVAGAQAMRGTAPSSSTLTLSPATRVEIIARPATRVEGNVSLRVLFVRGAESHRWNIDPQVSEDGAVRIARAVAGPLPVAAGEWDVLLVIARPGSMPDDDADLIGGFPPSPSLQVLRIPVKVLP